MSYSIFTILMAVTIEMQMSKGCLEYIQTPPALHYIPESLSLNMYTKYYTLLE